LEQFWSFGSGEIIFSLLSPSSEKSQFVITLPPHRNPLQRSNFWKFINVIASVPSPATNGEIGTGWNTFGALVLEK